MNLARDLENLLPLVDRPSRYLGTELGSVRKPLDTVDVRIALAFPDLYDLGLGNLGLHILYAILNEMEGVWAERVYAPALDMEALLRERGLPLFALESRDPLRCMDGIGVTLQSELNYTNILGMLDLAGLSLRTEDRRADDPIVFAGGPAVFNPEPLAPFIDAFVIGDGEDVIVEIAELLGRVKDRAGRLAALASLPGVYVPALYPMDVLPDGRVLPPVDGPKIRKRIARDLNSATFPVNYIVPFTRQVHDRVSLEVLRGCTQGCRFCQAGMTTRPVRERTIDNITDLMDRTLASTGYEEVSLVSLSTCDYSAVRQMVDAVVQRAAPERVGVSLPSLRLDSFSVDLADMVAGIRRTGLTFAPEAASPRLRALINKWIPDEDLLEMATKAYGLGWDHVKLYFMIGLPSERDDDIEAIADLTLRTLAAGRALNRKARVHTGVSTFVPKPFTPFQWSAQIDLEETRRRQSILHAKLGGNRSVRFGRHDPFETFLEGLLARADRRGADLLEVAYRLGCRFDGWDEHLNPTLWREAIAAAGTDVAFELRERDLDERLPWDHIDVLIPHGWLKEDYQRALQLQHAEDCRHSKCHRCGVIDEERELCAHMLRTSIAGRKTEAAWERPPPPPEMGERPSRPGLPPVRPPEPRPVQRLLFRICVRGEARFLTHLETLNVWLRALRRCRTPLSYTEGFHPHPRMAFDRARPLGQETLSDHMDILLRQRLEPGELLAKLQATLPRGFGVSGVEEVSLSAPSLMSRMRGACDIWQIDDPPADLDARIAGVLEDPNLFVERRIKKRRRRGPTHRRLDLRSCLVDLKPLVAGAPAPISPAPGQRGLWVETRTVEGRGVKPAELMAALALEPARVRVTRIETLLAPLTVPRVARRAALEAGR